MEKYISKISLMLSLVLSLAFFTMAQETTGNIEISVKDVTGAVVPNANVTVESSRTQRSNTTGFRRTATTDAEGFVRILQVPPGTYRVTVAGTSGFAERFLENVDVVLGKSTPVTLELTAAGATATVDVVATNESGIDPTDTKVQTSISQKEAELLPKGTNFASLLQVSPATRREPLSGGFQIDGASGSENTFIIDGNERTNAFSGELDVNNNLPFQLVQEFNVRSSGFEAEYGGATGGVVSVVTRGGSNDFRGEFGTQFRVPNLNPRTRPVLDFTGNVVRQLNYERDQTLGFFPTATIGGPIMRDRLWFFTSYTPQIFERNRQITYRNATTFLPNSLGVGNYQSRQKNEYAFARLDAQPFNSLRLNGTFTYNPIIVEGELPLLSTQFSALPNASANLTAAQEYQANLGGRQNAKAATGQAVWAPNSSFVASLRGGHNFINTKLGTYGRPVPSSITRIQCSAVSENIPTNANCVAGANNGIALFDATQFDATTRDTLDADVTYLTSFGGRHEFKGGYQYNGLANEVLSQRVNLLNLRYGWDIREFAGRGNIVPTGPLCANPNAPTAGCVLGSGLLQRIGTAGSVSSKNEGLFIQDRYQPFRRLTLNLGARIERENVPSFIPENPDLEFGWGSKFAPRIGIAYDLTGDGKTKLTAFYGWFYDRFKYELPRGSFGGDLFYQDYFEILPGDPAAFNLPIGTVIGSGVVNTTLGSCPNTGFVYGRIRCSINARVPSNAGGPVDIQGGIDPDIKPYRQNELTFQLERELTNKFVFSTRYSRKRLDRTIEDIGFINVQGSEVYIIGNPGEGIARQQREAQGFRPDKAIRNYDAVEFRLDRRFADNYYFNANYTWSRLYGNYSGLASSDEAAILGGEGRTDPNVSRYFDAPFTEATIAGGQTLGRLPTDRPHVFKFAGAYSLDWNQRFGVWSDNTTEFQGFFTAQSGTPQTTIAQVAGYNTIIVNGRGDIGRTATFTSTDFALRHRYRFGRDNRFALVGEVDILNAFNQNAVVARYNIISTPNFALDAPSNGLVTQAEINALVTQFGEEIGSARALTLAERRFQQSGAPAILTAVNSTTNRDPRYGQPLSFQAPREVRFGFRLIF
jgi:hypothetical protein